MKHDTHILIVDDDADDRKLFIDAIGEVDKSIICTTATDGKEALELLNSNQDSLPDLIFLDLRMPRFNGKRFLLEIKNNERLREIPIIIYSTSKELVESVELKDLGAVHFISKPSDPEEIYYVVSLVLEEQLNSLGNKK